MIMFCYYRFWCKRIFSCGGRHDEAQSSKDFCWDAVLDGSRGYGTSKSFVLFNYSSVCRYRFIQASSLLQPFSNLLNIHLEISDIIDIRIKSMFKFFCEIKVNLIKKY